MSDFNTCQTHECMQNTGHRMEVRLALNTDVPAIVALLRDCQAELRARQIDQWPASFPDADETAREVRDSHTHLLLCNGLLTATVTLSPQMPALAQHIKWLGKGPFLRVCRLAVHPRSQRKGFGRELMQVVEQLANSRHIASLRLGAYSRHPEAVTFYERLGYVRVGEVMNPVCPHPFICMEKLLEC